MNYEVFFVGSVLRDYHKKFIETHHYSKTARSQKATQIFELRHQKQLIGIALFGQPCGKNVEQCYGGTLVELRRFVLIDETERNAESWFLSRCLKILKNETEVTKVVSYSDPNFGHKGTIYKATNFKYLGEEKAKNPRVVKHKRKRIHVREMYQKTKGRYTKRAIEIQKLVKDGKARIVKQKRKLIFLYDIK